MSKLEKIILKLVLSNADKNFLFDDLIRILNLFNFEMRIKGSHHIFWKEGIEEIINIQPNGKLAKPYQVKQVREIILKYKLIKDEY